MNRESEIPFDGAAGWPPFPLPPELLPNVDDIIIQDDTPLENLFAEKQQFLLTDPLYSTWRGGKKGRPFVALANVGLFFTPKEPPLVPDVMLSLDVTQDSDISQKENNTYFIWTRGKVPDVVIEIVSDRRGGEETHKMRQYAKWGVPYYVIFDPEGRLRHGVLRVFGLSRKKYEAIAPDWLEDVGFGLTLWQGIYRDMEACWLRWCDQRGRLILTGEERVDKTAEQARRERVRRKKLEAQLRQLGIEPEA